MKKITDLLNKYGRLIAGLGILGCLAVLAVSYIRPKQKLETVSVNMAEEETVELSLQDGTVLEYVCSTKGYPMAGIQVGVCKYGQELADGALLCSVYNETKETLLSQTLISVGELDDGQYVYIPFDNYEQCMGTLAIEFTYSGSGTVAAGLAVNHAILEDAVTYVNGEAGEYMLKSYYIYKINYYPLTFDLCVLLFMFVGVFFLTDGRKRGAHE